MDNWLGFIEFFIVVLFALGWGVIELVCRRLDKKRAAPTPTSGETPATRVSKD